MAEPVIQQLGGSGAAERLSGALRVLATNDRDIYALVAAGDSALELNDESAAYGFYARAALVAPGDARVNAGLGRVFVRLERADEALARFAQAQAAGADVRQFAADRGLAHDLRGDFLSAQSDYRLAGGQAGADEVVRRLALSQAIGGDVRGGLTTLAPLLARFDAASIRAQAFILAMGGDVGGARSIAQARMSPGTAGQFDRFFTRLPALNPAERARAVHFGDMPAPGQSYASVRPGGGPGRSGGTVVAVNSPPPRSETRGRGGALIPRGPALGRSGPSRRPGPADTGVRDRPAIARTVRAAPPPVSPPFSRPLPPPPLPARIALVLPALGAAAPVVRAEERGERTLDPVIGATLSSVSVAVFEGLPRVTASVSTVPVAVFEAPPGSVAPAVRQVDLDAGSSDSVVAVTDLRPGDQVLTPDGPALSVPLAQAVPPKAPETLLPSGALPPSATLAAAPSPGFATAPPRVTIGQPVGEPNPVSNGDPAPSPPGAVSSTLTVRQSPAVAVGSVNEPGPFGAGTPPAGDAEALSTSAPASPMTTAASRAEAVPFGGPTPPIKPAAAPSPKPAVSKPTASPAPTPEGRLARATPPPTSTAKPVAAPPKKATTVTLPATGAKGEAATKVADAKAKVTAKPAPKKAPVAERYWYQVATGRDAKALAADFRRLQKKHDLLAKLGGVTSEFGASRRLVVGPFDSLSAAKAFGGKARAAGLTGYVWVSPEGFEVDPLPGS